MGCEAVPKQITSVLPDIPHAPVLLPVPGRSRTSPLLHVRDRGQAGVAWSALIVLKLAFMSHQETSAPADTSVR
ncbi:hypothetical protein CVE27_08620 [Pseudomonas syringae pv. actinidiae]|nr:hypothetical protein [Pseudomonas syringae pv. actinidiae]